ncbi:hypothetical protein ABZS86_35835 [Streptomyces sp. NPDC005355]|uniref:hypothetical protein n=1 Tax=Streptomyces sp. NPDC005355 TaxID=3157038 RepID=UPI0033BDAA40
MEFSGQRERQRAAHRHRPDTGDEGPDPHLQAPVALLIDASDYDEPGISSLPFVRDDLQRLVTALTDRGFHSAEIAEHWRGITPNFVNDRVSRFLRDTRRDDTLFILLSGHGQHFQGTDYLIPEDASFNVHPFAAAVRWKRSPTG